MFKTQVSLHSSLFLSFFKYNVYLPTLVERFHSLLSMYDVALTSLQVNSTRIPYRIPVEIYTDGTFRSNQLHVIVTKCRGLRIDRATERFIESPCFFFFFFLSRESAEKAIAVERGLATRALESHARSLVLAAKMSVYVMSAPLDNRHMRKSS